MRIVLLVLLSLVIAAPCLAKARYVVVKWTGNVAGTRIPESGLSTSRYEVRKAVP